MNLITTYAKIRSFDPCASGWEKLLRNCNPEQNMEKRVSLLEILDSNGARDAFWALRCWDYWDYCLLLAAIAESVLHIWTARYPDDDRPAKAIQAIRDWHAGLITDQQLEAACSAAAAAAYAAVYAAVYAAYTAVYAAAYAAVYAAVYAASDAADAADAKQWKKNEELMRKFIEI